MHATAKGFRWVVAALFFAASLGVAVDASACCGGGNAEPGGNTPDNYKLSGPALTGQLTLKQGANGVAELKFDGVCQGKPVLFTDPAWEISKPVLEFEKNCTGDVNQCAQGGFIESTILPVQTQEFTALEAAGCDDVFYRNPDQFSYIKLFVQAVPKFYKDISTQTVYSDVVLLFLIPVAK